MHEYAHPRPIDLLRRATPSSDRIGTAAGCGTVSGHPVRRARISSLRAAWTWRAIFVQLGKREACFMRYASNRFPANEVHVVDVSAGVYQLTIVSETPELAEIELSVTKL